MESVITECPYICAPNIMDTPDFSTKMVQLDMSGGSCIKAGTPISADGKVANDETAIGILLNDCHSCLGNARGLVVIGGRIKQDVAKNHSGITISDKAKAAMINVTFTGDGARAGGGGADDVYLIKRIINYDTQTIELQGDYAGALAAFNSGKRLKFVEAIVGGGQEFVDYESFAYYFDSIDSFFKFSCYNGHNFPTCTLKESGITVSGDDTHVGILYVDNPGQFFLTSPSNKLFRIKVSDTGELSTEEIT